jgi:hypothetical protein
MAKVRAQIGINLLGAIEVMQVRVFRMEANSGLAIRKRNRFLSAIKASGLPVLASRS